VALGCVASPVGDAWCPPWVELPPLAPAPGPAQARTHCLWPPLPHGATCLPPPMLVAVGAPSPQGLPVPYKWPGTQHGHHCHACPAPLPTLCSSGAPCPRGGVSELVWPLGLQGCAHKNIIEVLRAWVKVAPINWRVASGQNCK